MSKYQHIDYGTSFDDLDGNGDIEEESCDTPFIPVDPKTVLFPSNVGFYGYLKYVCDNNLWQNIGAGYIIIGNKDDLQSHIENLERSVIIYNPNNVPIRVKYMVFT